MKRAFLAVVFALGALGLRAVTPDPYSQPVAFSILPNSTSSTGGMTLSIYTDSGSSSTGGTMTSGLESTLSLALLRPGKVYNGTFATYACSPGNLILSFVAPVGYQTYLNGSPLDLMYVSTNPAPPNQGPWGNYSINFTIQLRPVADSSRAAAGSFSGIGVGKSVTWNVGLGALRNGSGAGQIMFREVDLAVNDSASRGRLYYTAPANRGQITSVNDASGYLRQLMAPQVFVDIIDLPKVNNVSQGYTFNFYTPSNVTAPGSGQTLYTINSGATPWKTIKVLAPTSGNNLTITETEGSTVYVSTLALTSGTIASGNYVWRLQEGGGSASSPTWLRTTTHTSTNNGGTPATRDDVVTVRTGGSSGTVVSKTKYRYETKPWGEELASVIADPDAAALTTSYTYYQSSGSRGHYRNIQSVTYPTGSWVAYTYYDDWDRRGQIKAEYRPFLNSPATYQTTDTNSGAVVQYDYAADYSRRYRIRKSIKRYINGTLAGQQDSTPTLNQTLNSLSYTSIQMTDAASSTLSQQSVDAVIDPVSSNSADLRSAPLSIVRPNQTKDAFAYYFGSYSGTTFTVATGGTYLRTNVFHGTTNSSGADQFTTYQSTSVSSLYLVPNKSTMDVTIQAPTGLVLRTETWVYTGSGNFSLIGAENSTYDSAGRLLTHDTDGRVVQTNTYTNGQLTRTVDASGVTTDFTYDVLGRVQTTTKKGVAASPAVLTANYSYPAQGDITSTTTYDGANRVVQTVVSGGSLSQTSSTVYDVAGRVSSQTSPGNFTTSFAYDPANRTITATAPGGATSVDVSYRDGRLCQRSGTGVVSRYDSYWINSDGRLACQRTEGGISSNITNLYWDWLGRQSEVWQTNPVGSYSGTVWSYNAQGQLFKVQPPGTAATCYAYDTLGQVASQWLDVNGNGTQDAGGTDRITVPGWSYVQSGSAWYLRTTQSAYTQDNASTSVRIAQIDQQLGAFTSGRVAHSDSYDVYNNVQSAYTDIDAANKRVVTWSDPSDATNTPKSITYNGLLVETCDKAGVVLRYEYDALGRATRTIDPRTGATVTAFKSGSNLVDTVTDPAGVVQASYTYDSAGRVATSTDAFNKVQRFAYTAMGQVYRQWGDTATPIEYGYDSMGRCTTMKTFRGGTGWNGTSWPASPGTADTTTWNYQPASGVLTSKVDAANGTVEYTYTSAGQLATRKWARGVTTTYSYSSTTGELTTVDYGDSTPDITYTYNRLGQIASTTDVTGTRTFAFNLGGTLELQNEQLPAYFNTRRLTYEYDTAAGVKGRLSTVRLGTAASPSADQTLSYGYSAADGRLASVTAGAAGFTSYTYNYGYVPNSHLVQSVTQTNVGYSDQRTYDTQRNLVASRSTSIGAAVQAQFAYLRDNLGRTTQTTKTGAMFSRYGAGSPGLATSYGYNDRGELTSEQTKLAGTSTLLTGRNDSYAYDNIGNRTSATHNGNTSTYTANAINEYTSRTVPGIFDVAGAASASATVTVNGQAADRQGEYFFKGVSLNNASAPAYAQIPVSDGTTSSNVPAYVPKASQSYAHDADGNMTDDGRWTYTYDAENRLIAMETATAAINAGVPRQRLEFTNDYLGRRVQKVTKSWNGSAWNTGTQERFVYRGWELIAVVNASNGAVVRSFFWGLDASGSSGSAAGAGGAGGLLMIQEAGESYLPAYDGMGNLSALMKASNGGLAAAYEYDAYGNVLRESGAYAASNPFRFATKYTDIETGHIYYGLRYYNPSLGRFNNRDPLGERGGVNLYGFCRNSPSSRWDVLGLTGEGSEFGGPVGPAYDATGAYNQQQLIDAVNSGRNGGSGNGQQVGQGGGGGGGGGGPAPVSTDKPQAPNTPTVDTDSDSDAGVLPEYVVTGYRDSDLETGSVNGNVVGIRTPDGLVLVLDQLTGGWITAPNSTGGREQVIAAGEQTLIQRYNDFNAEMKSRGVPNGGGANASCNMVNGACIGKLAPIPDGWTATLEHRGRGGIRGLFGADHWAVVARSENGKEILFDYWGNRPAAENPNTWFRDVYSKPLDNEGMFNPSQVLPDGTVRPGFGPSDAGTYMNIFWPPKG